MIKSKHQAPGTVPGIGNVFHNFNLMTADSDTPLRLRVTVTVTVSVSQSHIHVAQKIEMIMTMFGLWEYGYC